MKILSVVLASVLSAGAFALSTASAHAYCGVIEKSATAKKVNVAEERATREVRREVRKLRNQHGKKLAVNSSKIACLGGAVAIIDGKTVYGDSSCTVTQSFCVNP